MKLTISFQNMKHTPSLDERIEEKTQKLDRYFEGKYHAKWTCTVKDNSHHAEVELIGPRETYHASAKADNMYKTFDAVVAKLEKQIHKKHDRIRNKIHRKNDELVILAWGEYDHDHEDVA
jgi:putative sigma-54 modulation protein